MEPAPSPTMSVASGITTILDRLGEFFHILDLSFFISGACTLGAMTTLYISLDWTVAFPFPGWAAVLALLVACYIFGLISFSLGRWINGILFRRGILEKELLRSLTGHAFPSHILQAYLTKDEGKPWYLYLRLWQDLIHTHPSSLALSHLSRYWVMSAMFDGLAISFAAWSAVFTIMTWVAAANPGLSHGLGTLISILSIGVSVLMLYQGSRYFKYQAEDIIAALAARHSKLI
jgi:hypothetical protein